MIETQDEPLKQVQKSISTSYQEIVPIFSDDPRRLRPDSRYQPPSLDPDELAEF